MAKGSKTKAKTKKMLTPELPFGSPLGILQTGIVENVTPEALMSELAAEVLDSRQDTILGVNDYLSYINQIIAVAQDIKVHGEISQITILPSGCYMKLKDKEGDGILSCYINPYAYRGMGLNLEAGMEVQVSGHSEIFKRRSELSFRVEGVELAGEGALKKAYEMLKAKLDAENLFTRKRELPEFIQSIGIITSRTGAVIDDFRKNLGKVGCRLYLKDCRVEGGRAANQILRAIKYFNKYHQDLDCLVIMRGGGSLEDLQAFNNELVVREIFASKIPTICAIGHDRDIPLATLVGDFAPSTPTAAAQLINKSWDRLQTQLPQLERDLLYVYQQQLDTTQSEVETLSHRLMGSVNELFQSFKYYSDKITSGMFLMQKQITKIKIDVTSTGKLLSQKMIRLLQQQLQTVSTYKKQLEANNPERNLKLGYSLVRNKAGAIVRDAKDLLTGETVYIKLHKGSFGSTVNNIDAN